MTSRTGLEEMTHDDSGASDWDRLRERAQLLDLIQTFGQPLEVDPEVKALAALIEAAAALDAQEVSTKGRMLWDGLKTHGGREDEEAAQAALLDSILYGHGMWQQEPIKATHIDPAAIWKPNTPAEVDAFVDSLIRDDIDTRFRGTWRLSRLATALHLAYP